MAFWITAILSVIIDYATKISVIRFIKGQIFILGDFLSLELIYNRGIAFSIPIEGFFLKTITVIVISMIFIHYLKNERFKKDMYIDIAFGMILGGAVGNAVERLFIGKVTDFINLKYFAIFNFGDIFICIGIALYLVLYINKTWKSRK